MKILISTLIGWFLYSVTAYAQSDKEEFMHNVPDYLEYAKLSEAVYRGAKNVDGWQRIKDKRDPLSGFHVSIYQKGDELVVVFEGTQSVADIAANAPFINSEQAVQALEFSRFLTDRQQDFGGKQKITFTGHSLGGELAMIAGILYRDASIVTLILAVSLKPQESRWVKKILRMRILLIFAWKAMSFVRVRNRVKILY